MNHLRSTGGPPVVFNFTPAIKADDICAKAAQYKSPRAGRPCYSKQGFTFVEVLFAVILLGIGFILVAAIFPVALQQSQTALNETDGSLVCRDATRLIQSVATNTNFPVTGVTLVPFNTTQYAALQGSTYFTANPRFGWLAYYRRVAGDPYFQVWIVALQNPDFSNFTGPANLPPDNANRTTGFQAALDFNNEKITFTAPASAIGNSAVENAFVIVADDGGINTPSINGRILRLGNSIDALNYNLVPGFDLKDASESGNAKVFMIGKAESSYGSNDFTQGPNQDIACQTSFIQILN